MRFLHAVTTQDIAVLAPGEGTYAALVTDRGHPVADFFAYRAPAGDEVVLELPAALADAASSALERLIVADDVELSWSTADAACVAALDEGGAAALSELAGAALAAGAAHVFTAPRLGLAAIVIEGVPATEASSVLALRALTREETEARALAWGRPGGEEFAQAQVLNELGILRAVSFTKGCFMGQEILQRVRTQGSLKRRMVGLEVAGGGLHPGDALVAEDGTAAGTVTRAASNAALAFVASAFAVPGIVLATASDASRARVIEPPFLEAALHLTMRSAS